MYKLTMLNKNNLVRREYTNIDLPEDIESAADLIWIGFSAAVQVGRIIITDNATGKEVLNKVYIVSMNK